MQTFLTIAISILLALSCAHLARRRGRNPTTWFAAGAFFGVFALALLALLPTRKTNKHEQNTSSAPAQLPLLSTLHPSHTGKLWYFLNEDRTQCGPMSLDALSREWKEGRVKEQTYVWNEEMEQWQRFQEVIKSS